MSSHSFYRATVRLWSRTQNPGRLYGSFTDSGPYSTGLNRNPIRYGQRAVFGYIGIGAASTCQVGILTNECISAERSTRRNLIRPPLRPQIQDALLYHKKIGGLGGLNLFASIKAAVHGHSFSCAKLHMRKRLDPVCTEVKLCLLLYKTEEILQRTSMKTK